ncbi:MAG: MBL fold metallo-hydrolase, partial [Capnocytophaga gingivalis]
YIDDTPITLRFVPGHSPGSVAFYVEREAFIISGDALFRRSIGRTDLYKGNTEQLLSSIRSQLLTLPEQTKVYSGHGLPTSIGEEKQHNPFLQ